MYEFEIEFLVPELSEIYKCTIFTILYLQTRADSSHVCPSPNFPLQRSVKTSLNGRIFHEVVSTNNLTLLVFAQIKNFGLYLTLTNRLISRCVDM